MLKKSFLVLSAFSCNLFAAEFSHYDSIVNAIENGSGIRVVLNLKQCESTSSPLNTEIIGSITPTSMMVIKDKYITFSDLHFTTYNPKYPNVPVYEHLKYKLKPDNTLVLENTIFTAEKYLQLSKKSEINCNLGSGVKVFSVNN